MFKKSLVLSIAVVLTAVLFIFTGCQNPDAPNVYEGETNVDLGGMGPVDVTISNPDTIPELPGGFTYPDAAKVLTGDATDIALAFNGGILVADTSDATGGTVVGSSAPGTGYAYAQDGVDQVVWSGPGNRGLSATVELGSISVPPGKTLFIAAPLYIDGSVLSTTNQYFRGISVSDQGGYADAALSIQASGVGGAPVAPGGKPGKVVVLAGGSIIARNLAGTTSIVIGGELEIHRGALVDLGVPTPFTTTQGSKTVVYGDLRTGPAPATSSVNLLGTLVVKGGGTVDVSRTIGTTGAGNSSTITFGSTLDDITVESYGNLTLPGVTANDYVAEIFAGNLTVGQGVTIATGLETTTFTKKASFEGNLNATSGTVSIGSSGHLSIEPTGTITGTWNNFSSGIYDGTPPSLRAAIGATEPNAQTNNRITIAEPATDSKRFGITLDITPGADYSRAAAYSDLQYFASHEKIHLTLITSNIPAGNALPVGTDTVFDGDDAITTDDLVIVAGNNVRLDAVSVGDIIVKRYGSLDLNVAVTTASDITIEGDLTANAATFDTALKSLTIGDTTGIKTSVSLPAATLASVDYADTEITVNKNASLYLDVNEAVDPPGTITLEAGDANLPGGYLGFDTAISLAAASFDRLKNLYIKSGAVFSGWDNAGTPASIDDITFAALQKLTVDGRLDVPSTGLTFARLQSIEDSDGDVSGNGVADLRGWDVVGNSGTPADINNHAFDQLLAIKDLTVASLTNVPSSAGYDKTTVTPDKATTPPSGAILRVLGDIVLTNGTPLYDVASFTVERDLDLNVDGVSNITLAAGKDLIIKANATIYSQKKAALKADAQDIVLTSAIAPVLTSTAEGEITLSGSAGTSLTLIPGTSESTAVIKKLLVPGKLILEANSDFYAGTTNVGIKLTGVAAATGETSLAKGSIETTSLVKTGTETQSVAIIKLDADGTLSNGAASTFGVRTSGTPGPSDYPFVRIGSSIALVARAKIAGTAGTITFGAAPAVSIGVGTFTAVGAASIGVTNSDQSSAANDDTTITTIAGDFNVTGATPLALANGTGTTFGRLVISDTLSLLATGSQYDKVEIDNVTIDTITGGGAIFTGGVSPVIALNSKSTSSGTVVTKGSGSLSFGANASLKTGGDSITLPAYDATATTGGLTGSLALGSHSELTVIAGGNLLIGTGTTSGELDATSGNVKLVQGTSLIKLALDTGSVKGTLKVGTSTVIEGQAVSVTQASGNNQAPINAWGSLAAAGVTYTQNDIAIKGTFTNDGDITACSLLSVPANGVIQIAGIGSGTTPTYLNKDTTLVRHN
jgi:hypothetical protein